jgi:peptidoglycan/LPS O-acetylase OafA/YrhL
MNVPREATAPAVSAVAPVTAPAPQPRPKPGGLHIPSLDGLRAVSFLFVFFAHSGLDLVPDGAPGIFARLSRLVPGGFGVTVFFFLSGFLITTLLRLEDRKTGSVSLKAFYLRRVLRILPPFYLTLAIATLLALVGFVPGSPLALPPLRALALHYGNYWFAFHPSNGVPWGTPVYWSLAVEEHFYLLFPLLYLLTRRLGGRRQGVLFLALCGAILAWRCWLVFGAGAPEDRTYLCSDTRFDSILFGCALAVAMNPMVDPPAGGERLWKRVLLPAGIALLLFSFVFRAPWFRESFRYTLQGLGLWPLFVCAMRFPTWLPFRPLNQRHLAFVGVLSYSLYLCHHVAIYTARERLAGAPAPLQAAVALAASFAFAYVMYRLVERPFARLRRRFSLA